MENPEQFLPDQIKIVNNSVAMAEELVSNYYKMSSSQWLRLRYDIKTLSELSPHEIVPDAFAQLIRYKGQPNHSFLGSASYDFYKICLQDHSILLAMKNSSDLELFPFVLYIVTHELIHIVRFSKFLQNFDAAPEERMLEETRVHGATHDILRDLPVSSLCQVLRFYDRWRVPLDEMSDPQ